MIMLRNNRYTQHINTRASQLCIQQARRGKDRILFHWNLFIRIRTYARFLKHATIGFSPSGHIIIIIIITILYSRRHRTRTRATCVYTYDLLSVRSTRCIRTIQTQYLLGYRNRLIVVLLPSKYLFTDNTTRVW
jgi:hypothetical protein